MKTLIIISFLLISISAFSQKGTFVRIFDEHGKKFSKGFLVSATDSTLNILTNGTNRNIPVSQITTLKLKRSFGHTVMITTLVAGGAMAIAGAASADPDAWIFAYSAGEGAIAGLVLGAVAGGTVGSIVSGTTRRPEILVNRNIQNWPQVRSFLKPYMPAELHATASIVNH